MSFLKWIGKPIAFNLHIHKQLLAHLNVAQSMRWFSCWFHNVVLIADCSALAPPDRASDVQRLSELGGGSGEDVVSVCSYVECTMSELSV